MGLSNTAAITGLAEFAPRRLRDLAGVGTCLEQMSALAVEAVTDGGLTLADVDGLVMGRIAEAEHFIPATIIEYLGLETRFSALMDLGGASAVSGLIRAAMAIATGMARAVLVVLPSGIAEVPQSEEKLHYGASSGRFGSPQAEFEIPYGHLGQNTGYGLIAQRYAACYGYDETALARLVVAQRHNACANPAAIFHGQPLTVAEVLASPMIAPPLRRLEIVMPVWGGGAVLVTAPELARRSAHRPVWLAGAGEYLAIKTPVYAPDLLTTPVARASRQAFAMAGLEPGDMDLAQIYDCYSITVLLNLEDAGFCGKGEGMALLRERDLTWSGDFPLNPHGGQLSFGQPGQAGGMTQLTEAVRQLQGRAEGRQLPRCDRVYVSGTGGVMSEQSVVILRGE